MHRTLLSAILSLSLLVASGAAAAHEHYYNLADAADYTAESIIDQLDDRVERGSRILVVDGVNLDPEAAAYYRHQANAGRVIGEAMLSELTRQGLPVQHGSMEDAKPGDIVITSTYSRGVMDTFVNIKAVRAGDSVVLASQAFLVSSTLY